jgi:hypothetical protein
MDSIHFVFLLHISIWVSLIFFQRNHVSPFSFDSLPFISFIHHEGRPAGEKKNGTEREMAGSRERRRWWERNGRKKGTAGRPVDFGEEKNEN